MSVVNISAYQFVRLDQLEKLKEQFIMQMHTRKLNGTILLSSEGINLMLAGERQAIDGFYQFVSKDTRFDGIHFKESFSKARPFSKVIVRVKEEIIAMQVDEVQPVEGLGRHISPTEFKKWLDEGRDIAVLDTRNRYEYDFGTFTGAINSDIDTFRRFPGAVNELDETLKEKPIVMFCTGGVRCEKASLLMEQKGFKDVLQLEGGILSYFEQCGGAYWEGTCFVFDERVSLTPDLVASGDAQCKHCHGPVTPKQQDLPDYVVGVSCPNCIKQIKTA